MQRLLEMDPNLKLVKEKPKIYLYFGTAVTPSNWLEIFRKARENIDPDVLLKNFPTEEFKPLFYSSGRFQMMLEAQNLTMEALLGTTGNKTLNLKKKSLERFKNFKIQNFEDRKECFSLFQKSWLNPDQGPIIASLCFLPCYFRQASYSQMEEAWMVMSKKINSELDPLVNYDKFIYSDYTFCTNAYNFLLEYYNSGICNCECGSLLLFLISKICNKKVFLFVTGDHIFVGFNLNKGFETTTNQVVNVKNVKFGMYSEQIIGIYILILANREFNTSFILEKILDINVDEKDIVKSLGECNRKAVKNLLDSNTFDIIVANAICQYQKRVFNFEDIIHINSEKYFERDVQDILNNVKYTESDLRLRHLEFIKSFNFD